MTGKAYYEQAQVQQKKPKGSWVLTKMSQYYLRWVHVPNIIEVASNLLRWPTTVTSNTNCSNQIKNCSHQKQNPHIKNKFLTSNTNYSHQKQIAQIKRSAVGEWKLWSVFTRLWPDRHFVPAHGTTVVVGMFCSNCGRDVDNCTFCNNCGKGKLMITSDGRQRKR